MSVTVDRSDAIRTPATARSATVQVATCMLIAASEGFDLAAMGLAGPGMIASLGLTRTDFGLISTAMMAGFAVGAAGGGSLGDRHGRRTVTLWSLLVVAVFSWMTTRADGLASLVAVRFLAGVGIGGVYPNIMAMAAAAVPPERRARAVAITGCGGSLGGIAGGVPLAVAGGGLPWQAFFLVGAGAAALIAPLAWRCLPETRNGGRRADAGSTRTALFGADRAAITLLLWVASYCTAFMFYLLSQWAPTLLAQRGLPPGVLGAGNAALGAGAIVGTLALATLLDRTRGALPFLIVYGGMVAGFAAFGHAATATAAIASMALLGLTVMTAQLLLYAFTPGLYPPAMQAAGLGWSVAAGRLGAITSPFAVGWALDRGFGGPDLVWLMTPLIAAAALCVLVVIRRAGDRRDG